MAVKTLEVHDGAGARHEEREAPEAIAYGMSDLGPSEDGRVLAGTVAVPVSSGGCGKSHTMGVDDKGRVCIRCDKCAPVLIGSHFGWAASPAGVPLTPDEQGEVEIAEREGQVAMRMAMKAMGDTVGRMVQGQGLEGKGAQAEPPVLSGSTLTAQLAALSPAERAEIARLLAPVSAPPAPHPAAPAASKAVTPPATPPRKPGRPARAS